MPNVASVLFNILGLQHFSLLYSSSHICWEIMSHLGMQTFPLRRAGNRSKPADKHQGSASLGDVLNVAPSARTPAENIIPFSVLLVQDITRTVISWARAKH